MFDLRMCRYYDLCYQVAPELFDGPFYLMMSPEGMAAPHGAGAYADTSFCTTAPALRDALIADGSWRGPGPCVVFIELPTEGITLHELMHVVPIAEYPADVEPTKADRELEAEALAFWASGEKSLFEFDPWFQHEADWIRRTLHAWWRAVNLHSFFIDPVSLNVAGFRYALAPVNYYIAALGNEPRRLAGLSFAEIEAIEPPTEFTELFAADVDRWHSRKEKLCTAQ